MEIELAATLPLKPSISTLVDIERTDNDKDGWGWDRYMLYNVSLNADVNVFGCADIAARGD